MMKRYFRNKWVKVLAVMLAASAGTWATGAVWDTYQVVKMTEKMKTMCVGRMLIDLPDEATADLYGASIDGFDIEAFAESTEAFSARVATREAEIRAKPDRLGGNKNLETVREVKTDSGLVGKIFVHGRNVTEGQSSDGFTIEHYRYEGVALEAHVHGDGISIDVSAKDYDPNLVENLPRLVAQLVANPGNHIPTEPGFCVDRAYVRDPLTADQGEQIVLSAGLPSRPDIEIRFDTMAGIKSNSKGLLERSAASHARAPAILNMRFTNLRAASRTIGGLTGDELVERVVEENFAVIFGFRWEVNGTEDNVLIPDVALKMATGRGHDGPVPSSLSQPAALALWDKISSSVRVRPTAPPQVTVAASISPPLGTVASAGDFCPQSGYWQCNEGGNGIGVLGGQRQHIKRGQCMPQAVLLPQQTFWEKVHRVQSSYESRVPTVWKLVDKRGGSRRPPAVPLDDAKPMSPDRLGAEAAGEGEAVSIGSCITTGSPCPESGWWRCEEPAAVDATRWFAKGSLMPAATFTIAGSVFNRSGAPTLIRRRTAWRLVRVSPTPGPRV